MNVTRNRMVLLAVADDLDVLVRLFLNRPLPPDTDRRRSEAISGLLRILVYGPWPLNLRDRIQREMARGFEWLKNVDLLKVTEFPLPPSWICLYDGIEADTPIRGYVEHTVGRWIPCRGGQNHDGLLLEVLEEVFFLVLRKSRFWMRNFSTIESWFYLLLNDIKSEARGHAIRLEHGVREYFRWQTGKPTTAIVSQLEYRDELSFGENLCRLSRKSVVEAHDRDLTIQEALQGLWAPWRIMILLRYLESHTPREISEEMQLPLYWLKDQLQKALKQLYIALASCFPEKSFHWRDTPLSFNALLDRKKIDRMARLGGRQFLVQVESTREDTIRGQVFTTGSPGGLPWKLNNQAGVMGASGRFVVRNFSDQWISLEIDRVRALSRPLSKLFSQARFGDRRPSVEFHSPDRLMTIEVYRSRSGKLVLKVQINREVLGENPFPDLADSAGLARFRICDGSDTLLQQGYIGLYVINEGRDGFGWTDLDPEIQEGLLQDCRVQVSPCPAALLLSARRKKDSRDLRSELERSLEATDNEISRRVLGLAIELITGGSGRAN